MRVYWLLLVLILSFGIPGYAQPEPCPDDFTGYAQPRLTIGHQARVLPENPLNFRPGPTTQIARLAVIPSGASFEVLDDPRCNEGYVWWQVSYRDQAGWLAEGNPDGYWLEPRGELVILEDDDGTEQRYVRDADGNLEPEGCMQPPEDYTREQIGFATLNTRTLFMLDQAQRIYDAQQGGIVNFRQGITQGSYNPGGVSASFGTHDGGGAVDLSVRSPLDWSVLTAEIEPMIEALRIAGFAAWLRAPGDLYENSPIHIHAIAVGDGDLSPIAREQNDGPMGYLRGYDGLPRENDVPIIERHGGPVICNWMREMDFDDLRAESETALVYYHSAVNYHLLGDAYHAVRHLAAYIALATGETITLPDDTSGVVMAIEADGAASLTLPDGTIYSTDAP